MEDENVNDMKLVKGIGNKVGSTLQLHPPGFIALASSWCGLHPI